MQHFGSLFTPQTIIDAKKMTAGFMGDKAEPGILQAIKLTSGQTIYKINVKESVKRELQQFQFRLRDAGKIKNKDDKKEAMARIKLERKEFLAKVRALRDKNY